MDGKRKEVGRKATALDGLPIKQHYLRVFDDEWEKPFPHQRGDYYKKESFPKGRSPNMGFAGNDSLEKTPMLLAELKGGFSNSSFSFSPGQPSIGAPLIFIIHCK